MKPNILDPILINSRCYGDAEGEFDGSKQLAEKITIPSDLRFHSQALSVNVGNPCEPPVAWIRRSWRAKPFRASATTLKFRVPLSPLAKRQQDRELENFNFNLSGSDSVVANQAGVILPYEILLSTKKCNLERKS